MTCGNEYIKGLTKLILALLEVFLVLLGKGMSSFVLFCFVFLFFKCSHRRIAELHQEFIYLFRYFFYLFCCVDIYLLC